MTESSQTSLEQLAQSEIFERVSAICTAVNTATDAEDLLQTSLEKTMNLFGAKRGSIFLLNESGTDLELHTACGMNLKEEERLVKRMGEGVVGRVAQTKQPIVVDNIAEDNRFENFKAREGYSTSSFICAPLIIKDQLIGVINITDKDSGLRFKNIDLQLLDFLSSQIALNYRRIELYQKFKHIVKESQNLKTEIGKHTEEKTELIRQIQLKEKLANIGKLAGGIAHEFNNPLDGVLRYTNLCIDLADHESPQHGYLLEIKKGLNRMAGIVRSLLDCSRETRTHTETVDPNAAIQSAVQPLKSDLLRKHIEIKFSLDPNMKPILDLGLERVISNLCRNAADAIDKNGLIKILSTQTSSEIIIEIEDNGPGIPEENIEQIFEPFFTTKDIDKGCGLGLTIVSEIIKSYNGRIDIKSRLNDGTTFIIHIPI